MASEMAVPYSRVLTLPSTLKAMEDTGSERIVEGLASTPDLDETKEIVDLEAFEADLPKFLKNPIYTYCHDWRDPIGIVTDIEVREGGLWSRAKLMEPGTNPTADKAWEMIRQGIISAQSIGFDGSGKEAGEYDEETKVWHWKRIRLREIAAVPLPANYATTLATAKGLGLTLDLPSIEDDAIAKAQNEEERFSLDRRRLHGSAESIRNYVAYIVKQGRTLSPDVVRELMDAGLILDALLEPYRATEEDGAPPVLKVRTKPKLRPLPHDANA